MKTLARLVVPFVLKADAEANARTFEGLAAVWDLDLGNDIIRRGAFKKTIADWRASGDSLPLLNSHDHFDIMAALGQLLDAKETKDGLWTKWEVIDGPEGEATMRRLRPSEKTGKPIIGKMSIGFEPVKFSFEQPEGTSGFFDRIRIIEEANLKEVSLVLFPMAPGASIDVTTVKAFIADASATDPSKLDPATKLQLRKLATKIGNLLKTTPPKSSKTDDDGADDDEETPPEIVPPTPPAKSETPPNPATATPPASGTGTKDDDDEEADGEGKEGKSAAETPVYLFGEALAQRVQKTLLRSKMSDLGTQSRAAGK